MSGSSSTGRSPANGARHCRSDQWRDKARLWLDATYLKVRQGGKIVSVAAIIAMAVDTDGRREIIGLCVGPSEAETFWTEFLRSLKSRGLQGVKLVISDAHTGLKAAIARVFEATWQRCHVGLLKNALVIGHQAAARNSCEVLASLARRWLMPGR